MAESRSDRKAWLTGEVLPEDLDVLMSENGQAEANALHVRRFFEKYPPSSGSKILIHGCGTCQMFDYLKPADLGEVKITFADIGHKMLETARRRLSGLGGCSYELVIDDLENSSLRGPYDTVLLSMVLLHVDWKKCLTNTSNLKPTKIFVIEQEQPLGTPVAGAKNRRLPPSIKAYAEKASIQLVPRRDLETFLTDLGYYLDYTSEIHVFDGKVMVGFIFIKKPTAHDPTEMSSPS